MKKLASIIILLILLFLFFIFILNYKSTHRLLKIITPDIIQVDLNNNEILDENETICIDSIEIVPLDIINIKRPDFIKEYNLTDEQIISFAYITNEFSESLLNNKMLGVILTKKQNSKCIYGDIKINGKRYSDILLSNGYAAKNGKTNKTNIEKNIKNAQNLNLVILNKKNNIFHKLNCKYGKKTSNYILINKSNLPRESKPCKICHISNKQQIHNINFIPTIIEDENIKMIINDYTKILKPDKNCNSEMCKSLIECINSSKESIDIATFGWVEIPKVKKALENAKNRGIKIRIVTDATNKKSYYPETPKLISLADEANSDFNSQKSSQTNLIMHNKFLIFDRKKIFTGSMNLSATGLSGFNANTSVIITNNEIAKLYEQEFLQMLNGKFHKYKSSLNINNHFILNKSEITVLFSPYDNPIQYIITLINNSKKYIYIPAFLITHEDIINSLINAKKRGIDVKLIIDANNAKVHIKQHSKLRENNIQLKTENYAGRMHSKSIIIDDTYIITGSTNFSLSGNSLNDENMLIIKNEKLAKNYKIYFIYIWNKIPDKWLKFYANAEGRDSIGSCSDGIDNDFDGKIDTDDTGCKY